MKTSKIILAIAGLSLAGGMLTGAAAPQTAWQDRPFNRMFSEQLHTQLKLMPDQDRQWEALKDEERSLREKMMESRRQLHDAADAEFAKPHLDLAALGTAADTAHEQIYAARRDFRQHALAFYSGLSPEQQEVVINAIKEKRQRMERFLEKRHQRQSGEG
ncbi:MAG TPA: Spy/CpxP family protein refolding chaperone [Burkholderiales bacterium]|nr:Spy/CpxP family protein refolding chaperone [Burkholderiales bacterium]